MCCVCVVCWCVGVSLSVVDPIALEIAATRAIIDLARVAKLYSRRAARESVFMLARARARNELAPAPADKCARGAACFTFTEDRVISFFFPEIFV